MQQYTKTIWIVFFAIAMGYLESSVVVYLRALYYPEGFNFPMKAMATNLAVTELFREAATIIMILSVSVLAAKRWLHRFAWFLVIFAVWDSMYYVFLKMLLGWPDSFFTTDILFLLPSMWTGPVLAPIINSLTMMLLAWVILTERLGSTPVYRLLGRVWILLLSGTMIVLIAYMKDFAGYALDFRQSFPGGKLNWDQLMLLMPSQFVPRSFDWLLFCFGISMHLAAIFLVYTKRTNVS